MVSALETAITQLATLENAASLPGIAAGRCYTQPPEQIAPPCVVNVWAEEALYEGPDEAEGVPTGHQYECSDIKIRVYTALPDMARAQSFLLPIRDALRVMVNTHQTLNGSVLWAQMRKAEAKKLDYNAVEYHGMEITLRWCIDELGNFAT